MLRKFTFPENLQRLEETRWEWRAHLKGFLWIAGVYSKQLPQTLHAPIAVENSIISFWLVECSGPANPYFSPKTKRFKSRCSVAALDQETKYRAVYFHSSWRALVTPHLLAVEASFSFALVFGWCPAGTQSRRMEWTPEVSFLSSALRTSSQGPLSQVPQWPSTVWGPCVQGNISGNFFSLLFHGSHRGLQNVTV